MSTARRPVRCSGSVRPICQSQRIGLPFEARCGGYQQRRPGAGWQATGAGSGTTRHRKWIVVRPYRFAVRTATE